MKANLPAAMNLFLRGQIAFADIERNGIRIDVEYLDKAIVEVTKQTKDLEEKLKADPAYKIWKREYGQKANLGSDAQLGKVIYQCLGYPCTMYTSGGGKGIRRPSTSEEALKGIDLPFVRDWLDWQQLRDKVRTTYLEGIRREVVDGFLHCSFDLNTVASFRSSSSRINFQNLPVRDPRWAKLIRSAFIPRDDHIIVENDFKAIEVVMAALITRDPVLLDYVTDPKKDMHRDSAMKLFFCEKQPKEWWKQKGPGGGADVRYVAKNGFVFPSFYGSYYIKIARGLWEAIEDHKLAVGTVPMMDWLRQNGIRELGDLNPSESPRPRTLEKHIKEYEDWYWNTKYVVYNQWKRNWFQEYLEEGSFCSPTGFLYSGYFERNQVLNYPIQGAAFHLLLYTVIEQNKWLRKNKMRSLIVGQIHDSIIADVHKNEVQDYLANLRKILTVDIKKKWPWITVPLVVECEIAKSSWYEKREVPMPV